MLPQLRAALGPLQRQLAHGRRHLVPDQVLAVVWMRQCRQLPAQGYNLFLMLAPLTTMHTRLILLSSMESSPRSIQTMTSTAEQCCPRQKATRGFAINVTATCSLAGMLRSCCLGEGLIRRRRQHDAHLCDSSRSSSHRRLSSGVRSTTGMRSCSLAPARPLSTHC